MFDSPYWVAGGAITSYFTNCKMMDIDVYFPTSGQRQSAIDKMMGSGYECINVWDDQVIRGGAITFRYEGMNVDLMVSGSTPIETMGRFDFTVCCAAITDKYELIYHKDYFKHIDKKRLEYVGYMLHGDVFSRLKRLRKYIVKGYGIDREGILGWIDGFTDQHWDIIRSIKGKLPGPDDFRVRRM